VNFYEWFKLFLQQIKETDLLQWIGVSFSVAEVLLARANKIALYPAGIISVIISAYVLFHAGLYAEALLNGYYLVMSIYGWWLWGKGKSLLPVSYSTKNEWGITLAIVVVSFVLLYFSLLNFTTSDVPLWDAWVSALAWAGMWLLARRKIENWILLNISNAFAIPLLIHKELPLYALLTLFLFGVAVQGFFKWKRIIQKRAVLH
jgi:nicotinamide mononucleotide transporter